ncbi:MAG TPA: phosphatase PAP2 family protein [Acetobacteraceae bacterium]|nr:phosphatase PAP2 family protein [Acetobacteraceae bacterium]
MRFITDFADQAVILPVVVAIGITLLAQGWRRGAAAWVGAATGTFALMLLLKLVFIACPLSLGTGGLRTPSGHVAAATIVAGGLAALLLRRPRPALIAAVFAAVVIGVSRLALGAHSTPEVMVGAGVGLAGALALIGAAGTPPEHLDGRPVAIVAVVVALVFHGLHLPAEAHIRSTAWRISHLLGVCQSDELRLYTSSSRTMSSSPR